MKLERRGRRLAGLLATLGRTLLLLFSGAMAIAATVHAFGGSASLVATCGALSVFSFLASHIESMESLSGFGVNAKIRRLDQAIVQADEVLARVQRLAVLSSKSLLDNHARAGRMGINSVRQSWLNASEVRSTLTDIGVDTDGVRQALDPWASWLVRDIGFSIEQRCVRAIRSDAARLDNGADRLANRPLVADAQKFIRERIGNAYFSAVPTDYPSRLYEIAREAPLLTDADRQRLVAIIDEVSPVIASINSHQEIPDTARWLDDLQRMTNYHRPHGDPFDWKSVELDEH